MEKLNQTQLAELFAKESGMSRAQAEQFVRAYFDIIADAVLSDGLVKVKGLGTFRLVSMGDRESVNVNTGERITIAGHRKISFTPDPELKERLNRPFSAFETVLLSDAQAAALEAMETSVPEPESEPEVSSEPASEPEPAPEPEVSSEPALEPEPASDSETTAEPELLPQATEITQSRGKRIVLKIMVWILSVALVLFMLYILLWPLLGSMALEYLDNNRKIEIPLVEPVTEVADTAVAVIEAVRDTLPAAPVEVIAEETAMPAAQPVPAEKETEFRLNAADDARDLSEFTVADTVNYRMTGTLKEHVMKQGETLTIISRHEYGTKKLWPYIAAYNHLSNFKSLKPGAVILIPRLENPD